MIAGGAQQAQAAGLRIDGGPGNDTINGTQGVETIIAGDGTDFVDGNRGNDVAPLGAADDTFQWDPGDGSDAINGDTGIDTMLFNGANIAEKIDMSANGSFLRFTRDIASIVMDTPTSSRVDFNALGGADIVSVHDLSATESARSPSTSESAAPATVRPTRSSSRARTAPTSSRSPGTRRASIVGGLARRRHAS